MLVVACCFSFFHEGSKEWKGKKGGGGERERDRQRMRERESYRERYRERDRDRDRQTGIQTERGGGERKITERI